MSELTETINKQTAELGEQGSVSKNHVRNTLDKLVTHGRLTKNEYASSTGAHVYEVVPDEFIGTYGLVDLPVLHPDVMESSRR